jgi:hypothetical protein
MKIKRLFTYGYIVKGTTLKIMFSEMIFFYKKVDDINYYVLIYMLYNEV